MARVDDADSCWEWTGGRYAFGYGGVRWGGQTRYAHRLAWELEYGPIPSGVFVCHGCDNPPCCRPDHLFLGTPADNSRDAKDKGRTKGPRTGGEKRRGEQNGNARVTEAQVREIRASEDSTAEWARRLGITDVAIGKIRRRETWTHVGY